MAEEDTICSMDFYKSLHTDGDDDTNQDDMCLISHEPLTEYYQTLTCGHKFNYIPLYTCLLHTKYASSGYTSMKPKISEFKCPYCRRVQYELMPYIQIGDVVEVIGVNTLEMFTDRPFTCMYKSSKGTSICHNILLRQYSPEEYYCAYHFNRKKHLDTYKKQSTNLCEYVFVKGAKKGSKCGSSSKEGILFCNKHCKPTPKTQSDPALPITGPVCINHKKIVG